MSGCNCIEQVNTKLAEHNGMLETNWLSSPPRAMISVVKRAGSDRKKPPLCEATFCPFCGRKYPVNKRELASALASGATP